MINQSNLVQKALRSVIGQEMRPSGIANTAFPNLPRGMEEQRNLLGDILIGSSTTWKEDTLKMLDVIWKQETDSRRPAYTLLSNIPVHTSWNGTDISIWQGDITSLDGVDAIVNAANDQGLGCFVPEHKCIDNVIHRAAGPRLRMACQEQMNERGKPLAAGSPAMVTDGFHLPAGHVIHVTGPMVRQGSELKQSHKELLAVTYRNILEAASQHNITSMAVPCISTGLFGFPNDVAAEIAVNTVQDWLQQNPNNIEKIVFNTFLDKDLELYHREIGTAEPTGSLLDPRADAIQLAKHWIDKADSVLVVAGAGMSVKEGEMVYVNQHDFARHYPFFVKKYGKKYRTSYETMGIGQDPFIPEGDKWALHAKHIDNMIHKFAPNDGYDTLLDMVKDKDYFVLTSNVDGCFERSGFKSDSIYTPQGAYKYLQCMSKCRQDSVFDARPFLDKMLPHCASGTIPEDLIPRCPNCGGPMFGNVRGGSWFLHHEEFEEQNERFQQWMAKQYSGSKNVAVIEVGAGFNTPTVTRFPAESFVRSLGERGALIRINPSDPEIPGDLHAIAFEEGWQVLQEIENIKSDSNGDEDLENRVRESQKDLIDPRAQQIAQYFGKGGAYQMMNQLRAHD